MHFHRLGAMPPPPCRHYSDGHYVRNLVTAAATLGADTEVLLTEAGLGPDDLGDGARIRDDLKASLWGRVVETLGDPHLGLRVAEVSPLGRWGLAEQLLLHAETLGDGLETSVRFASQTVANKRFHLDRLGGRATYTMAMAAVPDGPVPEPWRHLIESDLAYAVRLVRLATSPAFVPASVWFVHDRPAGTEAAVYARLLGPDVRFGQPANALHFDAAWLGAPVVSAVPSLRVPLEVAAARELAEAEADPTVAGRVEALVRLDPATVTVADVAAQLGVSTRTLQRRLGAEGTSFAAVVDDVRRTYAEVLLRDGGVPLGEVSYRLGFSEPSALHRAIRRWFGRTATEVRQAAMA